jgi:uncharacterized membrane protein
MTIGILNRDLQVDMSGSEVPAEGSMYVPSPEKDEDGRLIASAVQTVQGTSERLYELWSDVTFIPLWQENVVSVTPTRPGLSHWVMGNPEDPDGNRVEFDSQVTEDVSGQRIAWKSVTESVDLAGSVTFTEAPCGRGTLVTLWQAFKVPLGEFGNAIAATVQRSPRQTAIEDLRHFKQLAETGEIPSVKGQPHGPRGLSGGVKEWMYGETNPTPRGTSDAAC